MARIPIEPDKPNGDGGGGGDGGQGPCEYGGKLGKNVKHGKTYSLLKPCPGGTHPEKASDGRWWCCNDAKDEPTPDPDRPPNCAGGIIRETAEEACPENLPRAMYHGRKYWCCPEKEKPEPEPDGDCPHGNYFNIKADETCPEGYVKISKPNQNIHRCECSAWCLTVGYEADCKTKKGGDGDGEQWTPSEDLQAIIQSLLARINELLGYDTGLSEEELQMIINRMTGNIKAGERGRIESMEDRMAGMGLLGTGMELEEYGKIGRQTREVTADVEAQVAIDQALRKYEEFMGTTGMAQSLFGTTLGAEQLEEILNAARRGEGRQDMGMMIQLLTSLLGTQGQDPYWQAILNQMGSRQRVDGGGGNDWMYWLPFLLS